MRNSSSASFNLSLIARERPLTVALAALSIALTGCAVGPDFKPPISAAPTSFTHESSAANGGNAVPVAVAVQWWKAYQSPEIDSLVERALAKNPTLDVALANLKAAQENVTAQRGLFYPTVQAGYSLARQGTGTVLSSALANGSTPYTLHTAQLSVGFTPDIFGGNRRLVESLQAQATSQAYQLDALRITLASNVVAAALQQASVQAQWSAVVDTVEVNRQQLEHLRRLKSSGYSSGLDMASQESAYAQSRALLPPLQKQLDQTRDLIAILCGELPSEPNIERLTRLNLDAVTVPASLPSALPSQLVAQRPDVQAAVAQAHANNALVGVAAANLLPQFSLTAGLGFSADALAGLLSRSNLVWGLVGGLTQPLFAGGALQARKRGAEALAEAAVAQYRSTVLTAFQNVADTLYALDADGQALTATRDAEAANARLLALTQKQFDLGYTSGLALLGVKQTYLQARLSRIAAQGNYLGDTVALYQSLGGGWTPDAALTASAHQGH